MHRRLLRTAAFASLAVCSIVASLSLWPAGRAVRTEDRNGDGRPDVWRMYDRHGQLVERTIDSNFDGRSDVREYYTRGALARRESARHFDDRIDLVEDFDPLTREHTRSLVDVDDDGAADLLVLFQAGRPVFSQWAPLQARLGPASVHHEWQRTGFDALRPLADPFTGDTAVSAVRLAPAPDAGFAAAISAGFPVGSQAIARGIPPAESVPALNAGRRSIRPLLPRAPRGPPVAL